MADQSLRVKLMHQKGTEEVYFAERDQKLLRDLREKAERESTERPST